MSIGHGGGRFGRCLPQTEVIRASRWMKVHDCCMDCEKRGERVSLTAATAGCAAMCATSVAALRLVEAYMSPGTQSQDTSSHKTTRVVC